MSGSSFTNVFGGVALRPAQPSYLALTIAENTALVWPLETTEGEPVVAAQLDITATADSLELQMPPGNTGSTGVQSIISNVGSDTFTVTDQAGNPITPIATTETWLITLIDNTTDNGTWRAIQIGATVSEATAAALAGLGLQVAGSRLQINWPTTDYSISDIIGVTARSTLINWIGTAPGILQLSMSTTLGVGFICAFNNAGTSVLSIGTMGENINGAGSLAVQPGASGFIICIPGGFISIGALVTTLTIPQGGTGAITANAALENFGGTNTGISIFTAPNAAAVVALLGLSAVNIAEMTINSDLALSTSSGNTAFVCTAALTLTLPLTTSLTNRFSFLAFAQGGDLTLTPQASDAIDNGSVGASFTIQENASAFIFTDAAGNWWVFCYGVPATGGVVAGTLIVDNGETIVTGGLTIEAGGFNVIGASTLDGTLTVANGLTISSGGLALNGGIAANGGMDLVGGLVVMSGGGTITGALIVTLPGTTGDEAVNFSQFPATLAVPGAQTLPSGFVEQWGTSSTVSGTGTISFAAPFATACLDVQLTIIGGTTPATLHPLIRGTPSTAGCPVFGDASESVTFAYRAIGN